MSDEIYLLIDFGSTYTKVLAIDLAREEVLGRAQATSTVQTNLLYGLQDALKKLVAGNRQIDDEAIKKARKLASSSAAGGLCIISVGLVPDLTLEAAHKAAMGAGAKVVGSHAYELDEDGLRQIEKSGCDMVLVVGGTDGGNKDVIIHNARMLASTALDVPFVVAGNRVVSGQVQDILELGGKYVEKTENVLPELDRLNVEPARSRIRDIFMKRIVHAKGLDKARKYIGDILMPTPMATLKAACLLADGSGSEPGLGELMVVEVGGATTNVHSVATGYSAGGTVVTKGIPEPYAKRTVEGDLGIRYNAPTILDIVGVGNVLDNVPGQPRLMESDLETAVSFLGKNVGFIPTSGRDLAIDAGLARSAVEVAVERHAGTIKESWGPGGEIRVQHGKDLTELRTIIGTGGIFAYNPHSANVLEAAMFNKENPFSLKPRDPDVLIDSNYMMYGIGLLSSVAPDTAFRIVKKYLSKDMR